MTNESFNTIDVRPVSDALGVEIHNVDLSRDISEEQFVEIRRAFRQHGVIFFREQSLTPEQHIAFARRWGNVNINRFFKPVDGYPMIGAQGTGA